MGEFVENFLGVYCYIELVIGIIAGLLIAFCTKKADGVIYTNLDRAGKIINIVLTVVYTVLLPLYIFVGAICSPAYGGVLGVIGTILAIIAGSTPLFAYVGLGASVALRKKGKSKLSFAAQFAGIIGMLLMFLIFCLCYGNLFETIN